MKHRQKWIDETKEIKRVGPQYFQRVHQYNQGEWTPIPTPPKIQLQKMMRVQ